MTSDEIRESFVRFFESHGHVELPSLPLIPFNDPSVLFVIAGMQQMIPFFLGEATPPARRLVTIQKVLRANELEEIGDPTHLSFFEMLGNFSVGDYFKKESLEWSWEYLTEWAHISPDRLWATIYPGDDEAEKLWIDIGVPRERIKEDPKNWWDRPGLAGPAGPNSEIYFDRGLEFSCGEPDCGPLCDRCFRFVEIWNNVFMTYFVNDRGEVQRPLALKNIDTGQGLERLAMVLQEVGSVHDTDLVMPIIRAVSRVSGQPYGQDGAADQSMRIIADHSRSLTMAIADGAVPGNEGRGYVLRRLLRRAVLRARMLGVNRPFMTEPVEAVIRVMSRAYPEVVQRRDTILETTRQEEERFAATLSRGLSLVEDVLSRAGANGGTVPGRDAFVLYDTYGFPIELTQEMAAERGLQVDLPGYELAFEEQQARSKEGRTVAGTTAGLDVYTTLAERLPSTVFLGYSEVEDEGAVLALVVDGNAVERATAGQSADVILDRTPFYAESGGQVGDTGELTGPNGRVAVSDTQRRVGLIGHIGRVEAGEIAVGDRVIAAVAKERRADILPHHSGTHLLHLALHQILGPEATQAGSLVAPDRLRFDFRWSKPLTPEQIDQVEDFINRRVREDLPVETRITTYDEAVAEGAMALFGEKYGDQVRMVVMGDSIELCGGTHVANTAEVGPVIITSESSIGSGIRRVEALAGAASYRYLKELDRTVATAAAVLETPRTRLVERASQVMEQLWETEKRLAQLTRQLGEREASELASRAEQLNGTRAVVARASVDSKDALHQLALATRKSLGSGVVVLGAVIDGTPQFVAVVSPDQTQNGIDARAITRQVGQAVRGGGGGSPEFAQGGGRDAEKLDAGLEDARNFLAQR